MPKYSFIIVLCCALIGACDNSADQPALPGGTADQATVDATAETTVATLDLEPGETSESYRIESAGPVWIGYAVLAGLTESEIRGRTAFSDPAGTSIVSIERLGPSEKGELGGFGAAALTGAAKFTPRDGLIEVRVQNLSNRPLKIRLYTSRPQPD